MPGGVHLVGKNAVSRRLAQMLATRGVRTHGAFDFSILVEWADISDLFVFDRAASAPFMLIEDAGGGDVAIGPIFKTESSGCFRCYIARRRANGGRECRPAVAMADHALNRIVEEAAAFFDHRSALVGEQVQISDHGEPVRHIFLPIPNCPCSRKQCITRSSLNLGSLVSERLGLVHKVAPVSGVPDDMTGIEAVGCRTDAFGPVQALNRGMAVDDQSEGARVRATGESLERYCAALPPGDLLLAKRADLCGPSLDLSHFPGADLPFDKGGHLHWVKAYRLRSGEEVWAPASIVYVPYENELEQPTTRLQSSVGLAAGQTLDEAIYSGLSEIIERDVCLHAWRGSVPVEKIHFEPYALKGLHLSRVPNGSGLEVVVAFLEQSTFPLTSSGLGARLTLRDAARHATLEALQSRIWLQQWLAANSWPAHRPPRTMIDNAVAHATRCDLITSRLHWLFPSRPASNGMASKSWSDVVQKVPDACYVDVTTSDVAAAGIKVVRILAPGRVLADDDALWPKIGGLPLPHPFG